MVSVIEEPRNARSRRTVAALVRAARELIEQEGFAALTMTAVAERAGVTRRGAYLHFPTRTDLLVALYGDLGQTEEIGASLQRVWDSPDAATALTEWAEHIARAHPRILGVVRAVEWARYDDPDAAELWRTAQGNWLKGCRRLMRRLADEGLLAPQWTVDSAADMMWALMSIDVLDRLHNERRWSTRRVATHLAALFHTTFTRTPVTSTKGRNPAESDIDR
jgi:AcrR family transcriptional regulator